MEFTLLFAALMAALGLYGFLWWEGKRGNAADCSQHKAHSFKEAIQTIEKTS